jgi:hypothetical protein
MMSRAAYRYTLYRTKRWWPHDTVAVTEGEHVWLDLEDEGATLEKVAGLIVRSGGSEDDIGQYAVDVTDVITGEVVTRLAPTQADLAAARSGRAGLPSGDGGLRHVSDEALMREVLRRITRH